VSERTCRCGHPETVHEHYRAGSDCAHRALCGCTRFRPARRPAHELLAALLIVAVIFTAAGIAAITTGKPGWAEGYWTAALAVSCAGTWLAGKHRGRP
jgi:hypothetical protein